jgi:hypothetical protein
MHSVFLSLQFTLFHLRSFNFHIEAWFFERNREENKFRSYKRGAEKEKERVLQWSWGTDGKKRVKKCAPFQQMDLQSDLLQFSESLGYPIFSVSTFCSLPYWCLFLSVP